MRSPEGRERGAGSTCTSVFVCVCVKLMGRQFYGGGEKQVSLSVTLSPVKGCFTFVTSKLKVPSSF